jgi:hypothetical protein
MISQRRIRIAALVILANAAAALQFLPSAQACVDECEKPKFLCMAVNTCLQMSAQQKQTLCQQNARPSCYAKCAFDCTASAPNGPCKGAPAIQCNYKSSVPAPCPSPICAVPVDFHQTAVAALGTGIGTHLEFEYQWGSSTGSLSSLQFCEVGEIVDYPGPGPGFFFPTPPFPTNTTNGVPDPTIVNVAGSDGIIGDVNLVPGISAFQTPYSFASVTSTQNWRYRCPCANGGNWVNVMGPLSIVRTVSQNTNGSWKYTITKPTGGSASFDPLP